MPSGDEYLSQLDDVLFVPLVRHADQRGWLIELYRSDKLAAEQLPMMSYVSQTAPGVARGPHEHAEQTDCFAFIGPGDFKLYLWDNRQDSRTFGRRQTTIVGESNLQSVIIPPGIVHAYKNISVYPGVVYNAPNRLYGGHGNRLMVDEIRHEDNPQTPYLLD